MIPRRSFFSALAGIPFLGFLKPEPEKSEPEKSEPEKSKDTGLNLLFNFMRENKGSLLYDDTQDVFVLLTNEPVIYKGSTISFIINQTDGVYCSFVAPEKDCDIESCFLKPAIEAIEREIS